MKFFNINKNEDRNITAKESDFYLGQFQAGVRTSYNETKYLKLAAVYRCTNLLSSSVASLPLIPYTYKDNWKYKDEKNTLFNLLNISPNPFQSAYEFKSLLVTTLYLKGNVYILVTRNNKGDVVKLDLLNTDKVEIIVNKDKSDISYKYVDANNKVVIYDKSQIIHIKNFSDGGLYGKSTIHYASEVLNISLDSENAAKNSFTGLISGLLTPKAGVNISSNSAKNAKENLVNNLANASNSIVILDAGLEYQKITLSPSDLQLIESRNFNIVLIASFFGVPPSLAFSQGQKFSTSEQETLSYLNNTLTPLLEKIESELYRKLFLPSEYSTTDLKFDVSNLLRTDLISQAEYYSKLFNVGALTVNEIREKINANYPQPNGNKSFIQVNMQDLGNLIYNNNNNIDNKLK